MRSKRKLTKKFNVNGHIVECTTVRGLADILGKSKDTILLYEQKGILPDAIIKKGDVRYYPLSLCERLKPIVKKFKSNQSPKAEWVTEITVAFNEERQKLCQEENHNQT